MMVQTDDKWLKQHWYCGGWYYNHINIEQVEWFELCSLVLSFVEHIRKNTHDWPAASAFEAKASEAKALGAL